MANSQYDFIASVIASNQQTQMVRPLITAQCATEQERAKSEVAARRTGYIQALGLTAELLDASKRDAAIAALSAFTKVVEG